MNAFSKEMAVSCFETEDLSNVLDIIRVANSHVEVDALRNETLKILHRKFQTENCTFFLSNHSGILVNPVAINLDSHHLYLYESHFRLFNPFDTDDVKQSDKVAVLDEHLFSKKEFFKTEYYNDFLKPTNIYHQLVIIIRSQKRLLGAIGLHRRKETGDFGNRELMMAQMIAPHLALALKNANLFVTLNKKGDFFQTICDCNSLGIAIFNEKLRPVYLNKKAVDICKRMKSAGVFFNENGLGGFPLPAECVEDCAALRYHRDDPSMFVEPPVRHRTVAASHMEKYSIQCQVIEADLTDFGGSHFLFTIEDVSESRKMDRSRLREDFELTKREMEIVDYIIKGYTNSEIADTVYISEGTVKNHLKSIFDKMDVKNRTSLIHKVLFS
jgi:DNA-binding CsgD family transcriptional regulator